MKLFFNIIFVTASFYAANSLAYQYEAPNTAQVAANCTTHMSAGTQGYCGIRESLDFDEVTKNPGSLINGYANNIYIADDSSYINYSDFSALIYGNGNVIGVDNISLDFSGKPYTSARNTIFGNNSRVFGGKNLVVGFSRVVGSENIAINGQVGLTSAESAWGSSGTDMDYPVSVKKAVSIGGNVHADYGVAIGTTSIWESNNGIYAGIRPNANYGVAIGGGARVEVESSVAIGRDSLANELNTVSFGNSSTRRRLVNIAEATGDYDAVNFGQMNRITSAMSDRISNLESSGSGFDPSALYEYVNAAESRANSYAQSVASGVEQRVYQEVESSEARANSYADNAASAAEGRANTYTDSAVAGAEQRANSYADNAASAAEGRANTYTDSAVAGVEDRAVDRAATYTNTVVAGVEDRAVGRANSYTDERSAETLAAANAYTDAQVGGAIEQSNAYTDRKIASLEDKLSAGIAAIAAQPQLPALRVGQRAVAVGTGHYNGRNAVGVAFGFAPTDQITVGGGVSGSDRGKPVFKTSASYVW